MKTWTPKKGEVERKWFVIDAKDKVLGPNSSGNCSNFER